MTDKAGDSGVDDTGISFVDVEDDIDIDDDIDDDDDDAMLDLFSFGADPSATTTKTESDGPRPLGAGDGSRPRGVDAVDPKEATTSAVSLPGSSKEEDDNDNAANSDFGDGNSNDDDSFIELLDQQREAMTADASEVQFRTYNRTASGGSHNSDMQDILDWLDDDDEMAEARGAASAAAAAEEEELDFMPSPRPPTLAESVPRPPTPPPPPKEFRSLEEAVRSHEASLPQIRRLLEAQAFRVDAEVRPRLWAKVICGKTLEEIEASSIADSFQQWEQRQKLRQAQKETAAAAASDGGQETNEGGSTGNETKKGDPDKQQTEDSKLHQQKSPSADPSKKEEPSTAQALSLSSHRPSKQEQQLEWLQGQSNKLAGRIASVLDGDLSSAQRDLFAVLANHYDTGTKSVGDESEDPSVEDGTWKDPLLPPVACAILSAGVPKVAAAVMTSHIIPTFMPILALTAQERQTVGEILQRQLYLLACYHFPLLVWHLDRYIPDWYQGQPTGPLPQSWLMSHMAGEAGGGPMIDPRWLLCLWDLVLTSNNNSLRFFLVLAVLENDAERLMMLTGDDLGDEFRRVVTFASFSANAGLGGSASEAGEESASDQASRWVHEWSDRAHALWEQTPLSVTRKLKLLEDDAVSGALVARQKAMEERMRLKLEAEAKAQQEAHESEREKRADAARGRLTRARLVAFYRQFNPGKEGNIDKILSTYEGRYEILDAKLKQKYGVGFNPALKPKPPPPVNRGNNNNGNILSSINVGFGGALMPFAKRKDEQGQCVKLNKPETRVVEVSASEVLPIVCWSKEANQVRLSKLKRSSKLETDARMPLKFYLVDSRTEAAAQEQGRFPTSVSMSPEKLVDLDEVKLQEESFEALRGSAHICVMGEGYAALPDLYGHKMTNGLAEFIRQDEARINECALFFLSRGFPFVSVLSGGFASAHAFLCREGHKVHLRVNDVLADYNPEVSLFGQFEKLHSASGREKAQISLQNLFDSSMTVITKNSMRFETLASELATGNAEDPVNPKGGQKNVVQRLFGGGGDEKHGVSAEDNVDSREQQSHTSVPFRNPFARNAQSSSHHRRENLTKEESSGSLVVESLEFDEDNEEQAPTDDSNPSSPLNANDDTSNLPKSESSSANPFSGFGAAINNSLKSSKAHAPPTNANAASGLARNRFAMFGNLGSTHDVKKGESKGPGMANHFAGLNQLRKNTLSRIRVPGKDGNEGPVGNVKSDHEVSTDLSQGTVQVTSGETSLPGGFKIGKEEDATTGDPKSTSSVESMNDDTFSCINDEDEAEGGTDEDKVARTKKAEISKV